MKRSIQLTGIFLCLSTILCFGQTGQNAQPETKPVVAVYPFTTSREYSYDYADGAGTAVEAGFVRSGRFTVVERSRFGSLSAEDHFKEANTADIVKKAARFGAKIIVTGNVVGVSRGDLLDYNNRPDGNVYVEISLSFKIIDVETGEIKMSEIIRGKGTEKNYTAAQQNAYVSLDKLARSYVASYLPQRFKFMAVVEKGTRHKQDYLDKFKIWGGSDNGLKVGDVVEVYSVDYLVNPDTKKKIEEKQLLAQANIIEVNSGETSTCAVIDGSHKGAAVLALTGTPERLLIEYKGNWYQKRTFLDALKGD